MKKIFCGLLLLNSLFLFSQADDEIDIITVTAAPVETLKPAPSASTVTVDSQQIAAANAQTAADALKLVPGVHINSNGLRNSIGSVSIRGSRSHQVLILIDGVAMLDPAGSGGYDLSKIPAEIIQRIEVIKGGGGGLYGDGAYAGVVNIITKGKNSSSFIRTFFNSQEGVQLSGGFSLASSNHKGLSGNLSASLLYNPFDLKIVGGDTIRDAILGYLQWGIDKTTEKYDIRFRSFFNENYNWEKIGNELSNLSQSQSLTWTLKNLGNGNALYSGGFSLNFYHLQWMPAAVDFVNKNFSAVLSLKNSGRVFFAGNGWELESIFNGDIKSELMEAYYSGFLHRTTISPSFALSLAFEGKNGRSIGVFDVGGRLETMFGDRTLVFPTLWGGLTFYFDEAKRYGLKTSAGNAFRAPTMSELYFSYGTVEATADLKAEKAVHFDVGFFLLILENLRLNLGYFYRHEMDTIWFDKNTFENLSAADFNGAELDLKGNFFWGKYSALNFSLGYELNYGFYRSGKPFDLNHRHIFRSGITYSCYEWFSAQLQCDVYSGFADIKPFVELNASLKGGYKGFFLELGVKNLLNQQLRYHNYTSFVPRSWSVGIGYHHKKNLPS